MPSHQIAPSRDAGTKMLGSHPIWDRHKLAPQKHIAPREGFSRSAMRASGSMYENEISRVLALALVLALARCLVLVLVLVLVLEELLALAHPERALALALVLALAQYPVLVLVQVVGLVLVLVG